MAAAFVLAGWRRLNGPTNVSPMSVHSGAMGSRCHFAILRPMCSWLPGGGIGRVRHESLAVRLSNRVTHSRFSLVHYLLCTIRSVFIGAVVCALEVFHASLGRRCRLVVWRLSPIASEGCSGDPSRGCDARVKHSTKQHRMTSFAQTESLRISLSSGIHFPSHSVPHTLDAHMFRIILFIRIHSFHETLRELRLDNGRGGERGSV